MSEDYTYTDAFEELQTIVSEIERGEISIDELSEKVKRASLLITVCKTKLTATEADVRHILAGLNETHDEEKDENLGEEHEENRGESDDNQAENSLSEEEE